MTPLLELQALIGNATGQALLAPTLLIAFVVFWPNDKPTDRLVRLLHATTRHKRRRKTRGTRR